MATSRIALDKMNELIPAADAKAISDIAVYELEKMSVAVCINTIVNTGGTEAVYPKPISTQLRTELASNGYKLSPTYPIAKPGDVTVISWGE